MALATELSQVSAGLAKEAPPDVVETILTSKADFVASFDAGSAIRVGNTIPQFKLSDARGQEVNSVDLLAQGPLLITFYRGDWCPFCQLSLRAFQSRLDEIKAKGVTLVAISPELPKTSLTTTETNGLKFVVLSDVGNKLARQLGIVFRQPESLRPVFQQLGNDLETRNGDDSFTVPVPTVLLVDSKGVVRRVHFDADWFERLEPATAVQWIDEL